MDLVTTADWWLFAGVVVLAAATLLLGGRGADAPEGGRRRGVRLLLVVFPMASAVWAAVYLGLTVALRGDLSGRDFWGGEVCLAALVLYLALRPGRGGGGRAT